MFATPYFSVVPQNTSTEASRKAGLETTFHSQTLYLTYFTPLIRP